MDVTVQPSVPWMSLNEHIKEHGLFFPVDPGPSVREWRVNEEGALTTFHRLRLGVW